MQGTHTSENSQAKKSTARSTWKRWERAVSKFFGTTRNPLSGGNGKHSRSDSLHPRLFIECKMREKHAAVSLFDIAAREAKIEGKTPVLALCEKGRPGFWILCKAEDLQAVAKEIADGTR